MSTYVIAEKTQSGPGEGRGFASADRDPSTVPAIFTDARAANRFRRHLRGDYEVTRLSAMQLLRWMVRVHEQGVHYLAVNPQSGTAEPEDVPSRLAIEQQLAHFAELLTRDVVACAESVKQDPRIMS
ncbi:MAG: hypothetical protein GXX96_33735 [Planctomycetaceae bacterium]|nr:hypothetical protein [Planctomycetaceae bacterium]